jgi:Fe-S-cluster containining protein
VLQRILDSSLSEEERLRALFAWIDEQCAKLAAEAVCSPGCAYCCRGPVEISESEACLIAEFSGRDFTTNAQAASSPFSSMCPLLAPDTGTCSVHEVRPSVCRTRFAFDDPGLCAKGTIHQTYNLARFADEHDAELQRANAGPAVRSLNGPMRADIRYFFA